jgi:hypothetical protein
MVDKAVRKSSRQLLQRRVYKLPQRIFVTEEDGNSTTEACIGFLCKGPFGMRSRQKRVVSAVYQDAMWFNGVGGWPVGDTHTLLSILMGNKSIISSIFLLWARRTV